MSFRFIRPLGLYAARKTNNNRPLCEGDVQSVLHYILWRRFGVFDGLRFLQIGASDGSVSDPIFPLVKKYGWTGCAVEPLKHSFERLQANYAGSDVQLVNNAISADEGPQSIYRIDPSRADNPLPDWSHQIASFDRNHLFRFEKHIPGLDQLIIEETVEGISLDTLLSRHSIDQVDLFQIDTEGYDYHIMKMIDFDRFTPEVINFEHEHLPYAQIEEIQTLLHDHGYGYVLGGRDFTAFRGIKDF